MIDTSFILVVAIAAILVNAIILHLIISSATKSGRRAKYEKSQLKLLAKIAIIQGVPEAEVKAIFEESK